MASISEVKEIIENQLGLSGISEDDRIVEDLGAESSDIINIVAAVEDYYNITVEEDQIQNIRTVRDVFMVIQG